MKKIKFVDTKGKKVKLSFFNNEKKIPKVVFVKPSGFYKKDVETLYKTLANNPKGCSEINKKIVDFARDLMQ